MLADDKLVNLLLKLSGKFNVLVKSVGVGMTDEQNECTVITLDDKTDPSIIEKLQQEVGNVGQETVRYKLGSQQQAAPVYPCDHPLHQCGCQTPKQP